MKRIPLTTFIFIAILSSTHAELLLSDSFNYPDGDLLAVSGGLWLLSSGATPLNVSSGRAVVTTSNAQDDFRSFTAASSGSIYYGLTVATSAVPSASGSYIATFTDGETGASTDFFGRLQVAQGSSTSKVKFGIINDSGNAVAYYTASEFDLNTSVRIVVKFDFSTLTSTLWIGPTNESSSSVTDSVPAVFTVSTDGTTSGPGGITSLGNILLRQASGIGTSTVDDLVVSTTFAEAVAVPEPGTAALLGLGFGAVLFGIRRRMFSYQVAR